MTNEWLPKDAIVLEECQLMHLLDLKRYRDLPLFDKVTRIGSAFTSSKDN